MARREQRILLTEDKDFGQLVFAAARDSAGVVLVRWPVNVRASLGAAAVAVVARYADLLQGGFAVLEPGRVRLAQAPQGG